ncbi:SIR2 family protein [Thermophilibacter provencensis]|uniref:hypothetical protein n=1 Tax=Thermophilibacter provencensis TaxID=1852386 RepID=UPI00094B0951|nr:hypothetical protein [Thermophilibacter provencensis]
MEKTLLIGNGLNLAAGGRSWDALLQEICPDDLRIQTNDKNDAIPQPIQFEMIGARENERSSRRGKDSYLKLKNKIKGLFDETPYDFGPLHHAVYKTKTDNIITTNYDFVLEEASGRWDPNDARRWNSQQKYLFESTGVVGGRNFFHCHGVCNLASSICIGYEHYMGYVQHMRSLLVKGSKDECELDSPRIARILNGTVAVSEMQWPILFFNSDIAILGLGLSFSELDLWWLLTFRAAFFSNVDITARPNKVTYFDVAEISKDEDCEEKKHEMREGAKAIALSGLNVQYVPIVTHSYKRGYGIVLESLQEEDGWD